MLSNVVQFRAANVMLRVLVRTDDASGVDAESQPPPRRAAKLYVIQGVVSVARQDHEEVAATWAPAAADECLVEGGVAVKEGAEEMVCNSSRVVA
jgi:hypothetical protein